jgi:hypothetical protein
MSMGTGDSDQLMRATAELGVAVNSLRNEVVEAFVANGNDRVPDLFDATLDCLSALTQSTKLETHHPQFLMGILTTLRALMKASIPHSNPDVFRNRILHGDHGVVVAALAAGGLTANQIIATLAMDPKKAKEIMQSLYDIGAITVDQGQFNLTSEAKAVIGIPFAKFS